MLRNRWFRVGMTIGAMAMVLLLAAGLRFTQARGFFTSVEDKSPGRCRTVGGISDVAAMATDPLGIFIVSRGGGLYTYAAGRVTRFAGTPADFHPVAMGAAGTRLQVLFGRADGSFAIAVFEVRPGKVTEVGRLTADNLIDPADLIAVDGERFYLVNRHGSKTALGRWLDDAFLLPRANVFFFDGMKFVAVAERLNSPEGLALSPDGAHLYVSEEFPRNLASFARTEFTGALGDVSLLSIPAAPGKITVAPDGSLIVAARPKRDMGQVWRVNVANGVAQSATLLYSSRHDEVAAAAEVGGHLLLGTARALLDCTL